MPEPEPWGIATGYEDAGRVWRDAPRETVRAILRSMGASSDEPRPPPPVLFRRPDDPPLALAGRWELHTEDGGDERVRGALQDAPLGYHQLISEDGRAIRLIVTPGKCHLPDGLRTWGWAVQLYSVRSAKSWGIGDLGDLRRLAEWSAGLGAGMLLVNPLHAGPPVAPHEPSPYYPSSRCFRSPLYVRVDDVTPNAAALNTSPAIDRDRILELKLDALTRLWENFDGDDAFDRFLAERGDLLQKYATYCALAERHGSSWVEWPADLRHPTTFEVREFAREERRRVRFHAWIQWLLELQLQDAGAAVDLVQDLAVGFDPAGADAWIWQDVIAPDMSVGAPPDEYNARGQDWGIPPFDPWKLRDSGYEAFVQTVRSGLRMAGGLRVDHVMGMFRLFWIPSSASPRDGTYVRYPSGDLLDLLALESHRAGAYVVGEDLGTVEEAMRDELAERDVLSYRLLWFEPEPPRSFPRRSLASVGTHDLPTVAGLWTGADLTAQRERGVEPNVASTESLLRRLRDWTGLDRQAPVDRAVVRTYELLSEAPSAIVTGSLEDALGVEQRPNYPGTKGGTNWSLALPASLEQIEVDPRVTAVAERLSRKDAARS